MLILGTILSTAAAVTTSIVSSAPVMGTIVTGITSAAGVGLGEAATGIAGGLLGEATAAMIGGMVADGTVTVLNVAAIEAGRETQEEFGKGW